MSDDYRARRVTSTRRRMEKGRVERAMRRHVSDITKRNFERHRAEEAIVAEEEANPPEDDIVVKYWNFVQQVRPQDFEEYVRQQKLNSNGGRILPAGQKLLLGFLQWELDHKADEMRALQAVQQVIEEDLEQDELLMKEKREKKQWETRDEEWEREMRVYKMKLQAAQEQPVVVAVIEQAKLSELEPEPETNLDLFIDNVWDKDFII